MIRKLDYATFGYRISGESFVSADQNKFPWLELAQILYIYIYVSSERHLVQAFTNCGLYLGCGFEYVSNSEVFCVHLFVWMSVASD